MVTNEKLMERIPGLVKAKSVIGDFTFSDFTMVRELHFVRASNSANGYDVELSIETDRPTDNKSIRILFEDVSGLNLGEFGGGLTQIIGLEIIDISERGWEKKKWQIDSYENSEIKFWCHKVSIVNASNI